MIKNAIDYVTNSLSLPVFSKGVIDENIDFIQYEGFNCDSEQATQSADIRFREYEDTHIFNAFIYSRSDTRLTKEFVTKADDLLSLIKKDTRLKLSSIDNLSNDENSENNTVFKIEFYYITRS